MFNELATDSLFEAKDARASLCICTGVIVGQSSSSSPGAYLTNYSQCLLNRQIDIFDDAILLLENNRIPSACAISRAMIETYAFAKFLGYTLLKALEKKSGNECANECLKIILKFTNSSRFKETEQKKVAKGIVSINDYKFTPQAKHRLVNGLAASEHVMNALRSLFTEEMKHTGHKESQFEMTYDGLSEWVHPSQTSIFHNYVPDTHVVPTSLGDTHIYDVARLQCARALHFITDSNNIHSWLCEIAHEIDCRST